MNFAGRLHAKGIFCTPRASKMYSGKLFVDGGMSRDLVNHLSSGRRIVDVRNGFQKSKKRDAINKIRHN